MNTSEAHSDQGSAIPPYLTVWRWSSKNPSASPSSFKRNTCIWIQSLRPYLSMSSLSLSSKRQISCKQRSCRTFTRSSRRLTSTTMDYSRSMRWRPCIACSAINTKGIKQCPCKRFATSLTSTRSIIRAPMALTGWRSEAYRSRNSKTCASRETCSPSGSRTLWLIKHLARSWVSRIPRTLSLWSLIGSAQVSI